MDFEHVHLLFLHFMRHIDNIRLILLLFVFLLNQWQKQGQDLLHLGVGAKFTMGLHLILAEWTFLLANTQ